jgi:hypothetical protein
MLHDAQERCGIIDTENKEIKDNEQLFTFQNF